MSIPHLEKRPAYDQLDQALSALRYVVKSINEDASDVPLLRHEVGNILTILSRELDEGLREVILVSAIPGMGGICDSVAPSEKRVDSETQVSMSARCVRPSSTK